MSLFTLFVRFKTRKIKITKQMLDLWGTYEGEVYFQALMNM